MQKPFNLKKWIDDNRHLLKPPVGNQQIYKENDDFIVMVVGGPNSRKDFHYNEGEELFYQLEGNIELHIVNKEGTIEVISIQEGDMFLLPPRVPHSPRRGPNTVGLVIEKYRNPEELDGFQWYCESCDHKIYEEYLPVSDIVKDLPIVMKAFWDSEEKRTCKNCGTLLAKP